MRKLLNCAEDEVDSLNWTTAGAAADEQQVCA
jgi:hypothetical protein